MESGRYGTEVILYGNPEGKHGKQQKPCIGLILKGFLIDLVIEGMNISKKIEVISSHPEQIKKFIVENLHRGATIYMAEGAFSHERREVVVTILNRRQAIRLRNYVRQIDKSAFMAISNTSEIIGKGFRNVDT